MNFHLTIAAPDGKRYEGDARMLVVRGIAGELAILAGHAPLVTALAPGECRVYEEEGTEPRAAHCSGGFLTVRDNVVRLLSADFAWIEPAAAGTGGE